MTASRLDELIEQARERYVGRPLCADPEAPEWTPVFPLPPGEEDSR